MATVGTNTVGGGSVTLFEAQLLATPTSTESAGGVTLFNAFPQVGGVSYVQRVYGSGNAAWCYYTQTSINPTPATGDTTPNWTGSITAHEVLAVI